MQNILCQQADEESERSLSESSSGAKHPSSQKSSAAVSWHIDTMYSNTPALVDSWLSGSLPVVTVVYYPVFSVVCALVLANKFVVVVLIRHYFS